MLPVTSNSNRDATECAVRDAVPEQRERILSVLGVRITDVTKSAAMELGPFGIRVNSIHPGLVKTPMTEWVPEDIFQSALGRIAQPQEVSNLVVYLASDDSSYSTGSEFVVDGGTTAGLAHKDFSAVDVSQQPEWVT